MSRARLHLFALTLAIAAGCSSTPRQEPVPPVVFEASVAHRDPARGTPTFVWITRRGLPRYDDARAAARATVAGLAGTFALSRDALAAVGAPEIHDVGSGPIVARFEQRVAGVPVFGAGLNVALTRAFEPVAATGSLSPTTRGASDAFVLSPRDVLGTHYAFAPQGRVADYDRFVAPGLSQPARVRRVFFPDGEGLEPAYYVEVLPDRGTTGRSEVVSAKDGRVLFVNALTRQAAFTYRVYADPTTKIPWDGPQGNALAPHPTGAPDGLRPTWLPTREVTLENYPFSRNDPWLAKDRTQTLGNNVDAYSDVAQPDGLSASTSDTRATVTGPATFGHVYDSAKGAGATDENVQAAVQQLFYVTNFLHDWFYDAGFDEKSGNPQEDNFGRGGVNLDPLRAEAQDYSGRNNSNAMTPADGASPRIQMFVFSGASTGDLVVTDPPAIAGSKATGTASFGKDAFQLSAPVALASDGQGADVADACETITAPLTGKIALAHRGLCSFVQKAQNAQAAGAVGLIITNVPGSASSDVAPFMGGTSGDVSLPVLSLALADGQALEAALGSGATVTMKREPQTDLDGSLDTTIVTHEWGHVLTNRLVGNGTGLTTNQAGGLGEGWSDFVALLLMARADDPGQFGGAYPNAAYAMSGSGSDFYFGIRRVPYSVDFTKNALTFKHIQNGAPLPMTAPVSFGEDGSFNAEVHAAGEVWATMLWECYVALLRDPRHTFQQAQEKMKRYLVASLKLTPQNPTFIEARDAVLAAAVAADEADFQLFFRAFARRGAGVGAVSPGKDSPDNKGVVESFEVGSDVVIDSATVSDDVLTCDHDGFLDDGETGSVKVKLRNVGTAPLTATTARLVTRTPGVTLLDAAPLAVPAMKPLESSTVTLKTRVRGATSKSALDLAVVVDDPSLLVKRTLEVALPVTFGVDEVEKASTKDAVDTPRTAWTVISTAYSKRWTRVTSGHDGWWAVPNGMVRSDHRLISPKFTIEGTSFGLTFRHRYSFRSSTRRKADFDGGVLEYSLDNGSTWIDLAEVGTVDYTTTLDTGGAGDNMLKGRRAYGNKSAGYPDAWVTSHVDVNLPKHPDGGVQVRFRMATGTGFFGAPGWEIDDIELTGIVEKPFTSLAPHEDACDGNGPTAFAPAGQRVPPGAPVKLSGTGTHPKDLTLAFEWTQESGPSVPLEGATSPSLSFVAPPVDDPVTLTFALRVNDGALVSPASRVSVVVTRDAGGGYAAGGGCACGQARGAESASGLLMGAAAASWLARRRRRRDGGTRVTG